MNKKDLTMAYEYNFTLGELVFTIRKTNKLTQVEYSKKIGVVQSTISKVEKDIFDDVPFSLISKISQDFKVPISYFQIGHLPLRRIAHLNKVVPADYVDQGVYKAKTIFNILKELEGGYTKKIYKDLKLPYQLLCISTLQYSFQFINKLYHMTGDDLKKAISSIKPSQVEVASLSNIKKYVTSYQGISLKEPIIEFENGIKFELVISNNLSELSELYLSILELEFKLMFGNKMEFINNKDSLAVQIYAA